MPNLSGLDVSHHQGVIDWASVNLADLNFCFIKATDGIPTGSDTGVDPQFAANWAGAKSIGMIRGAYHFFRPARLVVDQVSNFAAQVTALDLQDLPPALDLEIPKDNPTAWITITPAQAIAMAIDWLTRVQTLYNRKPIVYMDLNFYNTVLGGDVGDLKNYALWIARYTSASDPGAPADWNSWQFWQYDEQGSTSGIDSSLYVDLDRFNGSLDDLKTFIAGSIIF